MRPLCPSTASRVRTLHALALALAGCLAFARPALALEPFALSLTTPRLRAEPAGATAQQALPETLRFNDRPAWIRRLERAAKRGVTVASLHENQDTTLVFGMNRRGYIGFFTVPRD